MLYSRRMADGKDAATLRVCRVQINLTDEERRRFVAAAEREHVTLSAWLRAQALRGARASEGAPWWEGKPAG